MPFKSVCQPREATQERDRVIIRYFTGIYAAPPAASLTGCTGGAQGRASLAVVKGIDKRAVARRGSPKKSPRRGAGGLEGSFLAGRFRRGDGG